YGPKIAFHLRDSLGRSWQCGTFQVDFAMPERFEREDVGPDGNRHRPVMIQRAICGCLARVIGILVEQYACAIPHWLAPLRGGGPARGRGPRSLCPAGLGAPPGGRLPGGTGRSG